MQELLEVDVELRHAGGIPALDACEGALTGFHTPV
jgi:hypothetical protein